MGNRPHRRRTLGSQRSTLHLRWCTLLFALMLTSTLDALAQANPTKAATVELRIQLDWSAPSSAHPATIVLAPADHTGVARELSLTSDVTLKVPPGRYQLTTTTPLVIDRQAYGWNVELALFDPVNDIRLSQENAVKLARGDVIEPAATHTFSPMPVAVTPDATTGVNARAQIAALLNRWVASSRARDLRAQMSCYAPQLARYLQQRNVSSFQVQAEKRKQLELYTQVRRFGLSDISLTLDGAQAAATAVKTWDLTNHEVESRGNAVVHFEFAQVGSRWVITSEWESPMAEKLNSAAAR